MKVFVSSVIGGFEAFREASVEAIETLGHQALRSEDFPASATSPQIACLAGIRASDAVVVVLGARYGPVQASGISATHEEFREAKDTKPTLVFVQDGVEREPAQGALVTEARDWIGGAIAPSFRDSISLRNLIVRGLHELELSRVVGSADPAEIAGRALSTVPLSSSVAEASTAIVVAAGPRQAVLRPAQLEDRGLVRDLMQAALFGDFAVLDPADGTSNRIHRAALVIEQPRAKVMVDSEGSVLVLRPANRSRGWNGSLEAIIHENIIEDIRTGLRFADAVLERVDPTHRLSSVVPITALLRAGHSAWRTAAEQASSPQSMTMNMGGREDSSVSLTPPDRPRPALRHQAAELALDLATLLRRATTER